MTEVRAKILDVGQNRGGFSFKKKKEETFHLHSKPFLVVSLIDIFIS